MADEISKINSNFKKAKKAIEGKADASALAGKADVSALEGKQDTISDLETIRSGAEAGATALQTVPDSYALKTDVTTEIENKIGTGSITDWDEINTAE